MIQDSELITQLKLQYGDIFGIELGGVEYIYRALTIDEINSASQFKDDVDIEDYYVKTAVLYPENFDVDNVSAGYIMTLAEAIMSVSGILDVETVKKYLEDTRVKITNDVVSIMKAYIIAAMPTYREDELDSLTIKGMIEKVVLSEQILTLKQAVMGVPSEGVKVQIISAEEFEEVQKPKENKKLNKKKLDKTREQLLQELRSEERDTVNPRLKDLQPDLSALPDDILEKVAKAKEPDVDDPIAAKLFGFK